MRVTLDREADAVYIRLRQIESGGAKRQQRVDGVHDIVLDFDADDRLIGIEVLDASRLLPQELLDEAELI